MKNILKINLISFGCMLLFAGCGTPVIIEAIESNDIQKVKSEVEKSNVNAKFDSNWTPLHYASRHGRLEIVKYFIEKDADINAKSYSGATPLYIASIYGNMEIVKYLIEKGADVHAKNNSGHTPLYASSNFEIAKYLIEKGADINVKGSDGHTPLTWVLYSDRSKLAKYFIDKGADINVKDNILGHTPLQWASLRGYLEIVKYLIDKGADINAKDNFDWTPLHSASSENHLEIAKYLIEKGADTSIRSVSGKTYLDFGSPETKAKLIAMQKDIQRQKELDLQTQQQNKLKEEINSLITKQDFEALKTLTEANPNYVNYIANDELRLMLTGPKGMKVGDIMKLLQNGKSETIVVSLIKQVEEPYKKYTLEEIDILTKMGLTDKTIATMIDVTTEILKDDKKRKEQESYLAEQKKASEQKVQTQVIYQTVENNSNNSNNDNALANEVQKQLIQKGTEVLFKKLFR